MSVSDPLLKQLKGFIFELRGAPYTVTDEHPKLQNLCSTLELIFRKGLKKGFSLLGVNKKDYWHCIHTLVAEKNNDSCVSPVVSLALEAVRTSKKVITAQGKGRFFIRLCLQRKLLYTCVKALLNTTQIHLHYTMAGTILGDEILSEIFLSLLYELGRVNFQLNTNNASFLDQTWILPTYEELELVPCKMLGLHVQHVYGRILVIAVDEDGVASEDGKILAGDIITDIFNETLRDVSTSKISSILKQNRGRPVRLSIAKGRLPDNSLFPPIASLVHKLGHSIRSLHTIVQDDKPDDSPHDHKLPPHAQLPEHDYEEVPIYNSADVALYSVKYIGKTEIGQEGNVDYIATAVRQILNAMDAEEEEQRVLLELGETDVSISEAHTNNLLFKHSYTRIASCGRRDDCVQYFCYIVGEIQCTLAKRFVAYLFEAAHELESRTILYSLAQGFQRTHWFV